MLYFMGDAHGQIAPIIRWGRIAENSTIIHVGDLLLNKGQCELLAENLAINNNSFFSIRGNHEFIRFDGQVFGSKKNLTLVSDYTILELCGKRILCIGGAISIDRFKRKEDQKKYPFGNFAYFEDEAVKFYPEKIESNIDILVTHTAPKRLLPLLPSGLVNYWSQFDSKLIEDLEKENKAVSNIYRRVARTSKLEHIFFGHFHQKVIDKYLDIPYRCLDISEIVQYESPAE